MSTNEINELNRIRTNHDIGYTWLAEQLNKKFPDRNYSRHSLYSLFNQNKNITITAYREIKSVFEDYNLRDSDVEGDSLSTQAAELTCSSAKLTTEIIKSVEDDVISKKERKLLKSELDALKFKIKEIEEILG